MSERTVSINVSVKASNAGAIGGLTGDLAALKQAAADSARVQVDSSMAAAKALQTEMAEAGRLRKELGQVTAAAQAHGAATQEQVEVTKALAAVEVEASKVEQERAKAIKEVGVEAARTVAAVVDLGDRVADIAKKTLESGHGMAIAGVALKGLAGAAGLAGPAFAGMAGVLGGGAGLVATLLIAGGVLKVTEAAINALVDAVKVGLGEIDEMAAAGHRLEAVFSGDIAAIGQMNTLIGELDGAQPFFEDDQIANAAAMARMFNMTSDEIQTLLPAMADMAAVMETDLNEAINRVGLGLQGSTRGLKAWGIDVEEGASRGEVFAAVLAKAGLFHDEAGEKAEDHAGKVMAIEKAFKNAKTSVAELFVPAVRLVDSVMLATATTVEDLAGGFENLGEAAKNNGEWLDNFFRPRHAEWTVEIKVNGGKFETIDDFAKGGMLDFANLMKLPAATPKAPAGFPGPLKEPSIEDQIQADLVRDFAASQKFEQLRKEAGQKAKQEAQAVAADQVRLRQSLNRSLELAQLDGFDRERRQMEFQHMDRIAQAHGNNALIVASRKQLWFDTHAIDVKESEQAARNFKTAGEKQAKAFIDGLKRESAAFRADAIQEQMEGMVGPLVPQQEAALAALKDAHKEATADMWDFYIDQALDAYGKEADAAKEETDKWAELRKTALQREREERLKIAEDEGRAFASARDGAVRAGGRLAAELIRGGEKMPGESLGRVVGDVFRTAGPPGEAVAEVLDAVIDDGKRFWAEEATRREDEHRRAVEASQANLKASEEMQKAAETLKESQMSLRDKLLGKVRESMLEGQSPEEQARLRKEWEDQDYFAEIKAMAAEAGLTVPGLGKRTIQSGMPALDSIPGFKFVGGATEDINKLPGLDFGPGGMPTGLPQTGTVGAPESVLPTPELVDRTPKPGAPEAAMIVSTPGPGITQADINELVDLLKYIGKTGRSDDSRLTPGSSPQNPVYTQITNFKDLWAQEPRTRGYRPTGPGTRRAPDPKGKSIDLGGNVRTPA